ncbi:gliding motility-associated ABC transporter permease subunit GldF [Flavobacterium sp. HSC-61S13]|uniref:gliding motility-associated ABC transporter permease subunit GldF n=1 Tax=Flavobacterium sp. HSC-61S13 TaxID=2910963 RepID=UPI0020A0BD2A|nr:gliding motility-associated ABC transporter permease subunit GldF [Flavobacterium sp. HSC-61S13]MCP1995500.1 ABC-2 type transport system permease protein [Flavobacterium sp. HSC-61S13]
MNALLFREIKSFFGSLMGYLVMAVFLVLNGLFLWVFDGNYNILQSGYADINPFFSLAPWILIFLIPAVTMKSFSEEIKQGTMELLLTKPLRIWEIVMGKFLGAFVLIVMAVIPTLIYVWVVSDLSLAGTHFDWGSTWGSYFGLLFLIGAYTAIGIFASTLSENQIVSFIIAVLLCFLFFVGIDEWSKIGGSWSGIIANFGINSHFKSMGRGVLDTRDILYFVSFAIFFLSATIFKIKSMKK